jgi:hypothetical protein
VKTIDFALEAKFAKDRGRLKEKRSQRYKPGLARSIDRRAWVLSGDVWLCQPEASSLVLLLVLLFIIIVAVVVVVVVVIVRSVGSKASQIQSQG